MRTVDQSWLDGEVNGDWPDDLGSAVGAIDLRLEETAPDSTHARVSSRGALDLQSMCALEAAERWLQRRESFGSASIESLLENFADVLRWAVRKHDETRGPFGRFAAALFLKRVYRPFLDRHPDAALKRELRDERFRKCIRRDRTALGDFVVYWRGRLEQLQRDNGPKWRVPCMPAEEVREELLVQLVAHLIAGGRDLGKCARPACEATFVWLAARKDRLRRDQKLYEVLEPADLDEARSPSPEDLLLAKEEEETVSNFGRKLGALRNDLSPADRAWFAAFQFEARATGRNNVRPGDVAQNLGRDRSAATHALKRLRLHLQEAGIDNPWSDED